MGENRFLAFCEEEKRFFTFRISDRQVADRSFVKFTHEPDFFGIQSFAAPIYFGLHPKFGEEEEFKFVLSLDYKMVD